MPVLQLSLPVRCVGASISSEGVAHRKLKTLEETKLWRSTPNMGPRKTAVETRDI